MTLPAPLPQTIEINPTWAPTPNEMRKLKAISGMPLGEIMGGDAEDMERAPDRTQALIWIALHRAGHEATWDQAGDVVPVFVTPTPDPSPTDSSGT